MPRGPTGDGRWLTPPRKAKSYFPDLLYVHVQHRYIVWTDICTSGERQSVTPAVVHPDSQPRVVETYPWLALVEEVGHIQA